jgi:hypothetical protein
VLPQTPTNSSLLDSPQSNCHYDHYCHHYCCRSLRADLGRPREHLSTSLRHVRVAHGPRGRAHAPGQGHRARVLRVRPRDHARLPARQRGPSPQRVRLPGPRRLSHAYTAAWRDAIVKELRAYKATSDHLFSLVLGRCFDEMRFLRLNGGKAAKTHPKARAHRAWRRNAERMQRNWAALRRPHDGAPLLLIIKFGLSPHRARCAARARSGRF